MLKRKVEVNYRKASTRWERCKYCARREWTEIDLIGGVVRHDWRCEVVGLENSRRYGIADDHVCDFVEVDRHG